MNAAGPSCRRSFSPWGYWNQVPVASVQAELRRAFARWGRPHRLQVDNGAPWGSWSDLPTDLTLWLVGLDIAMSWIAPRSPQDNGVIERSQGTGKRWAEPQACRSVQELQRRLTAMDRIQREVYPVQDGRSRWDLFPQLRHSGRPYTRAWEEHHWSLASALGHLSEYVVARVVDKTGQVSLYNRNHYVGTLHAGKDVYVWFDPQQHEWIFADAHEYELRRKPAPYLNHQAIVHLEITHRAGNRHRRR